MPGGPVPAEHAEDRLHRLPGRIRHGRRQRGGEDWPHHVHALPGQHLRVCEVVEVHILPRGHSLERRPHWLWVHDWPAVQLPIQALLQLPRWLVPGSDDPQRGRVQVLPQRQDVRAWRQLLRMRSGQEGVRVDLRQLRRRKVSGPLSAHQLVVQGLYWWSHVARWCVQVQLPAGPLVQALSRAVRQVRRRQVHGCFVPRDRVVQELRD